MESTPCDDELRALRAVLDHLPERVARLRRDDLEILYVNDAQARFYGVLPDEMRGTYVRDHVDVDHLVRLRRHFDALAPGQPLIREIVRGEDGWIEWVDQLIQGEHGEEILSVGRNVTDRQLSERHLRESEQRFDLAMDAAPIGMALIGLDGRFLRANPAMCRFLRRTEAELLTLTTLDVTAPDHVDADRKTGRAIVDGSESPDAILTRYVRGDGTLAWGLAHLSRVCDDDGQPLYLVGQVVDVTEQVEREAALQREADDERDMAAQLRELDQLKDAFLSAVSHEFRTPLTALKGFAELLRSRYRDLPDVEVEALLDRLVDNADRLAELLGDLLDLSRMTTGGTRGLRRERVDLAELVLRMIDADELPTWRLTCILEPVQADVEVAKIERVVENLLVNAVLHTPPSARIWVRLVPDADGVRLTVEDDGSGVPDALKPRVFEPFRQGASEAAKVGGTGIGLSVVARFVLLHRGRVWVDDRPGGGARFNVWLPCGMGEPDAGASTIGAGSSGIDGGASTDVASVDGSPLGPDPDGEAP